MSFTKEAKAEAIKKFAQSSSDTGSTQVQISLLTERIADLTGHLKINAKDFSCKRGLLKLVAQRKKLLRHLQETNPTQYQSTVEKLGLRN